MANSEDMIGWRLLGFAVLVAAIGVLIAMCSGCAALRSSGTGVSQQAGLGIAANEATGVSLTSAMPIGLTVLMGWLLWLSHRREVKRIEKK